MLSLTGLEPSVFICLASIASLPVAFAASDEHLSDVASCPVLTVVDATGASFLQTRRHVSLKWPLDGARHGGIQKAFPIDNSLGKLADSSDAAGTDGPEALPRLALPNLESIPMAIKRFFSEHSSAAQLSAFRSKFTVLVSMLPLSLMLLLCSAIVAILHRIAAAERAEDLAHRNRTFQFVEPMTHTGQGEHQKSAPQSIPQSLSYISYPTMAELASPESPPNNAARSAEEADGSSAASSQQIVAEELESLEGGVAPCDGVGQTVPRMSDCSVLLPMRHVDYDFWLQRSGND